MYKALLALLFIPGFCCAQNNYLYTEKATATAAAPAKKETNFPVERKTYDQCIGERFMLMRLPDNNPRTPYPFIKKEGSDKALTSEEGVGKILILKKFTDNFYGVFEDSTGVKYNVTLDYERRFYNMVLLSDVDYARDHYMNKTVWIKEPMVEMYSKAKNGVVSVEAVKGLRGKVVNITASDYPSAPVKIIVKLDDGRTVFVDSQVSATNLGKYSEDTNNTITDNLWFTDPKVTYKYSKAVWELIRKRQVGIGMNKQQVILSWGKPSKVNKSVYSSGVHEQWVYEIGSSSDYVYFQNGKVTGMN